MLRLIYNSRARHDWTAEETADILNRARARNRGDDLTGMLIYHERKIFQVLEGPPENVRACFSRIKRDARHGSIGVLSETVIEKRAFSRWQMGYAAPEDLPLDLVESVVALGALQERVNEVTTVDYEENERSVARHIRVFLLRCKDIHDKGASTAA